MTRIILIFRLLLALSMITVLVCVGTNCTRSGSNHINSDLKSNDDKLDDKCDACAADSFFIKPSSVINGDRVLISQSVAIQFFNRVHLLEKYDNKRSYDTLMRLFNMNHWSDRNVIYALTNQYFYFLKEIKPFLMKNSITIIDSVSDNRLLEFRHANFSVVVDPSDYKDQDGVLFFLPGKKPLFWTADAEDRYCRNVSGIVSQYFLCPVPSD